MLFVVNFDKRKYTWCKIFTVSNCPFLPMVSNCQQCQIVLLSSNVWMCIVHVRSVVQTAWAPEGREGQSQKALRAPRLLANHNFHHQLHQDGDFCLDLHRTDGAVLEELCQEIGYTPQLFEATDLKGRNIWRKRTFCVLNFLGLPFWFLCLYQPWKNSFSW